MDTTTLIAGMIVLVGWGKLGPDETDPTANTFPATVIGPAADPRRVELRSNKSGKRFTMVVGGPWLRGVVE